jgi:hypothetical protein
VGIIEHDRHGYEARIPRKTKTQSAIELEPGELSLAVSGTRPSYGRAERRLAKRYAPPRWGPPLGRRGCQVSSEGLDETIERTRLRAPLELPDGAGCVTV